MKELKQLEKEFQSQSLENGLKTITQKYPHKSVFSSSLGVEDQIISHAIFAQNLEIEVFTLDTGRLFKETYHLLGRMDERYGKKIKTYFPNTKKVEQLVTDKGHFSFYDSVENRKECCYIRKVEPLQRALRNKKIWITGLRSMQSEGRKNLSLFEWDEKNTIIKFNPLIDWSLKEVNDYVKKHHVPTNKLHEEGFPSIGCQPCTRAVKEGEDIRTGRWWWEDKNKKECGLHG